MTSGHMKNCGGGPALHSRRNGCACSMASLAVHQEEHATRLTPKMLVQGPAGRNACPPRTQTLPMLDGLPLQDVEKLWPRMAMGGEDHARPTADQLHRPAIGPAKVLHLHACDRGGGSPRAGGGIRKQVARLDGLCGFCHLSHSLSGSWLVERCCAV